MATVEYDPWTREVSDDPYPHFRRLRDHAPVYHVANRGLWVISRYADLDEAIHNSRLFSSSFLYMVQPFAVPTIEDLEAEYGPAPDEQPDFDPHAKIGDTTVAEAAQLTPSFIEKDGEKHARERRLVQRMFTPNKVAELEPMIRELAEELFDEMVREIKDQGVTDYKNTFSWPLAVKVTARLMSITDDDAARLARLAEDSLGLFALDPRRRKASEWAFIPYAQYFQRRVERSLADGPASEEWDLIERLREPDSVGDRLTIEEVMANAAVIFRAGFETTANILATTLRLLDSHREQLELLRSNLDLIPNAVEETMRYDGPVQGLFRVTTEDAEVSGTTIPKGSVVQLLFASANRDERHFDRPDEFLIERPDARDHFTFGAGEHLCVGAALARMEMRIAWETFLSRVRDFRVVGDVPLYRHVIIRGPESVPLSFELA